LKQPFPAAAVLSALVLASACAPKEPWQARTLIFFDTVCDVNLSCSELEYIEAEQEISRIFETVEALFAPRAADASSPLVLRLYGRAQETYRRSGGAFDITIAPVMELWGMYNGQRRRIPNPEEIRSALALVGMENIVQQPDGLRLAPAMGLDWGGIAKGFGVDLAAQAMIERGVEKGFINAGGDLYCWGTNPEGRPWRIGVRHPRRQGYLAVLNIANLGTATSGDYQRYFEVEGVRYHHIFDPKTGYPVRGKQSVTVIGPETTVCDALSTALFVSQRPEDILKAYPEYGAICVSEAGKITLAGKKFNVSFGR